MKKFIFIVLMMISFVSFTSCTNDDSEYIDVNKELCISEWRNQILSTYLMPNYYTIEEHEIDEYYQNKNNNHSVLVTYTQKITEDNNWIYLFINCTINEELNINNICIYKINKNTYALNDVNINNNKITYLLNMMYRYSLIDDYTLNINSYYQESL